MCLAVRLVVAGKVHTSDCDPTDGRGFPDSTPGGAAAVFELAHGTDVDREDPSSGSCHSLPSFQMRLCGIECKRAAHERTAIVPGRAKTLRPPLSGQFRITGDRSGESWNG